MPNGKKNNLLHEEEALLLVLHAQLGEPSVELELSALELAPLVVHVLWRTEDM